MSKETAMYLLFFYLFPSFFNLSWGKDLPFENGKFFVSSFDISTVNKVVEFVNNPSHENREFYSLIYKKIEDITGHKISEEQSLIVFLSFGDINQIYYFKEREYVSIQDLFKKNSKNKVITNPIDTVIYDRNIIVAWIVGEPQFFSVSVDLEVTKLLKKSTLSYSYDPTIRSHYSVPDSENQIDIGLGVRSYKLPYFPAFLTITFSKKESDSLYIKKWSKDFQVLNSSKYFFRPSSTIFIPVNRHELNQIRDRDSIIVEEVLRNPSLYITYTLALTDEFREHMKIVPDISVGISLPIEGSRSDYVISETLSWPIEDGLFKFDIGAIFHRKNRLNDGFNVGDLIPEDEDGIDGDNEISFIIGGSLSLTKLFQKF
jgi:hypothetical protein